MYKKLFLMCLFLLLLSGPVLAQSEFQVKVALNCTGNAPEGREYHFRVVDNPFKKEDEPNVTLPETFTLKAGETKTLGTISVAGKVRPRIFTSTYQINFFQEEKEDIDNPGEILDKSLKQLEFNIDYNEDNPQENTITLKEVKSVTDLFGKPEGETVTFTNAYPENTRNTLTIKSSAIIESYTNPQTRPLYLFNENGPLSETYQIECGSVRKPFRSGDALTIEGDSTYTISSLPEGTYYYLGAVEGLKSGDTREAVLYNTSGKVPDTVFVSYNSSYYGIQDKLEYTFETEKIFRLEGLPDELYRVKAEIGEYGGGFILDDEFFINGEKTFELPELINPVFSETCRETLNRRYHQNLFYSYKLTLSPVTGEGKKYEYEVKVRNLRVNRIGDEGGSEEDHLYFWYEPIATGEKVTGIKNVNGVPAKENSYDFEITPVSAQVTTRKSYIADLERIRDLPDKGALRSATKLAFTDTAPPESAEDLSFYRDGSVMIYKEGDTTYITSGEEGKKVVAEDFKLSFLDFDSLTELDVTMLHPKGALGFGVFPFGASSKLQHITGLGELNTHDVTSLDRLFYNCTSLESVAGIENWDTSNVLSMAEMFYYCGQKGQTLSLPNWDVSKVKNFDGAFDGSKYTSIDLSFWRPDSGENFYGVFGYCPNLEHIYAAGWPKAAEVESSSTFSGSEKLPGYSFSTSDSTYCKNILEGGYFSTPQGVQTPIEPVEEDTSFTTVSSSLSAEKMPVPEKGATVTNEEGEIDFGHLMFPDPGTYTYKVKEKDKGEEGVTFDPKEYTINYTVSWTDEQDVLSGLEVESQITPSGVITYNNTKEASTQFTIPVEKVFKNQPEDFSGEFTYSLAADSETESKGGYTLSKERVTVAPGDPIDFGPVTFENPGTYTFEITEEAGDERYVHYDTSHWQVTVTVSGEEELVIENVEYSDSVDNGTEDDQPTPLEIPERPQTQESSSEAEFINIYAPPEWMRQKVTFVNIYQEDVTYAPKITKTLETDVTAPEEEFTFTIREETEQPGCTMPEKRTCSRTGAGDVLFPEIRFSKAGEYHFIISENKGSLPGFDYDSKEYQLKVRITDDGGVLTVAEVSYTLQ